MNIDLQTIKNKLGWFVYRFHMLIFSVVIIGSLAGAMMLLLNVISGSGKSDGYVPSTSDSSFDEDTIAKIKKLHRPSEEPEKISTNGRTNPFTEGE